MASTKTVLRSLVSLTAAVGLAIPVAAAGAAQAADYSPLGKRGLAGASLSADDVPRWMRHGVTPVADRTFLRGDAAARPDLCLDANGDAIEGQQPRRSMESMVNTRENLDDFRFTELNSNIYEYRSRAAAVRAWNKLQAGAHRCAGTIEVDVEAEGNTVKATITTHVGTTQPLFGTPGITLFQDVDLDVEAGDIEVALIGDQYASYYLAGMSIIRVEYANINGLYRGIGRVNSGFVDTFSIVVAQRVERRSLR